MGTRTKPANIRSYPSSSATGSDVGRGGGIAGPDSSMRPFFGAVLEASCNWVRPLGRNPNRRLFSVGAVCFSSDLKRFVNFCAENKSPGGIAAGCRWKSLLAFTSPRRYPSQNSTAVVEILCFGRIDAKGNDGTDDASATGKN